MAKSNHLIRKRSAEHKVYVPNNARENQYLIIETRAVTDIVEQLGYLTSDVDFNAFYLQLSNMFFESCKKHDLNNVSMIAGDKLVRVRYGEEQQVIESPQQMVFFYNPKTHISNKSFYDPKQLSEKITFLILATGDQLRDDASLMHNKTVTMLEELSKNLHVSINEFKLKDHQHITYDLFTSEKGHKATTTHGFRQLKKRYLDHDLHLPEKTNNSSFAIVNIPVSQHLLSMCDIELQAADPYNPLYTMIADKFVSGAKQYNLAQLAVIANGQVPVVMTDNEDYIIKKGELIYLAFQSTVGAGNVVAQWNNQKLVDNIQLVFIPTEGELYRGGYGRFVNHVSKLVKQMCKELEYDYMQQQIILRFHQHMSYEC